MESVHANPIPLAAPNSPLNALLNSFFDPGHTLQTIAKSLGLTLEGLLNYIATPEVAAAIDHAEAVMHRRAANRATAAIEQVLYQLQSLPPIPAAPSQSDTDRHRKNLEASRRAADLLRKTISPHRDSAARAPGQRSTTARTTERTATPQAAASVHTNREQPRPGTSTDSRPPWNQPAISFRPPPPTATPAAPLHLASSAGTCTPGTPVSPEMRRTLDRMAERNPDLYHQAPALFGTPYTRGQAG
ncbi:MAG: hypothetical protein ACOYN0_20060 [Phycisphaerales bacterium]